jgi:hypothetical protein
MRTRLSSIARAIRSEVAAGGATAQRRIYGTKIPFEIVVRNVNLCEMLAGDAGKYRITFSQKPKKQISIAWCWISSVVLRTLEKEKRVSVSYRFPSSRKATLTIAQGKTLLRYLWQGSTAQGPRFLPCGTHSSVNAKHTRSIFRCLTRSHGQRSRQAARLVNQPHPWQSRSPALINRAEARTLHWTYFW